MYCREIPVESKKILLATQFGVSGGLRWRDWRPVLDHILNYSLHVQKVRGSKSRHLGTKPKISQSETKHTRTTNRVPSGDSRESFRAAARVRPRCDIVHAHDGEAVQPRIGKSKGFLTPVKQVVV